MERVPILKIGDILFVSIQIDLQDASVLQLQEDLAEELARTGAHGVIIDITAVEIVDSFIGAHAHDDRIDLPPVRRGDGPRGDAAGRRDYAH